MLGLFYDEIEEGRWIELGSYSFTRENILAFAKKFDPQPFHVDDEAAARGPFGKLAASGWHTASAWMKCFVASNEKARAKRKAKGETLPEVGPGAGLNNLKWLKPVYPGDTIAYRSTIKGKREMAFRPEWGLVDTYSEGVNQKGEVVFSFESKVLVARR